MTITATKFRQNIYKLLDQVVSKGKPIMIKRRGKILKVVDEQYLSNKKESKSKKQIRISLKKHPFFGMAQVTKKSVDKAMNDLRKSRYNVI